MANLLKLNVIGITYTQNQSLAYALVLGEENGSRRISVVVGATEAQAIAMHLQGVAPSRPLTHDLFATVLEQFHISLRKVVIYKLENELFFSEMWFRTGAEEPVRIESRTSDAIALAVRTNAPIYTTEEIMSTAGMPLFAEESSDNPSATQEAKAEEMDDINENNIGSFSTDFLEKKLSEAIQNEAYERAALLQKELKKRKT